jgi:hypothetical protein
MLAGAGLHMILANVLQPEFQGLVQVIERMET